MKPEAVSGPAIRLVIKPLPGPSGYAFNLPKDDATHAFLSGILRARLPCSPRYLSPTLCVAREVPVCETRFQPQNPTDCSKQLTKEPWGDQKDGFPLFSLRKMQPLQSKMLSPSAHCLGCPLRNQNRPYRCLSNPFYFLPCRRGPALLGYLPSSPGLQGCIPVGPCQSQGSYSPSLCQTIAL